MRLGDQFPEFYEWVYKNADDYCRRQLTSEYDWVHNFQISSILSNVDPDGIVRLGRKITFSGNEMTRQFPAFAGPEYKHYTPANIDRLIEEILQELNSTDFEDIARAYMRDLYEEDIDKFNEDFEERFLGE